MTVQFAPANQVRIEQIRDVVRTNGFAPRAADVQVIGTLSNSGDTLALAIAGSGEVLLLREWPGAAATLGALRQLGANGRVAVSGQMPATDAHGPGLLLLVRFFRAVP